MEKLHKIQQELKAPKNQLNKFGGYKYRSLEDIMEAVKPLLDKNKCNLYFSDNIVDSCLELPIINATASLYDSENGLLIHEVSAQAGVDVNKKGMDVAQSFGASSSYARKYAANGLFLIDDTRDADATNDHGKTREVVKKPLLTKASNNYKKVVEFMAKQKNKEIALAEVMKKYDIPSELQDELKK